MTFAEHCAAKAEAIFWKDDERVTVVELGWYDGFIHRRACPWKWLTELPQYQAGLARGLAAAEKAERRC